MNKIKLKKRKVSPKWSLCLSVVFITVREGWVHREQTRLQASSPGGRSGNEEVAEEFQKDTEI
jgi:hypothetical protein